MKYDDASWHQEGDSSESLPEESCATHMGMYLGWVIHRGLVGSKHKKEAAEQIEAVRQQEMTGVQFIVCVCDGKLSDEDLGETAQRFTASYYQTSYFENYIALFPNASTFYQVDDSSQSYRAVEAMLDRKFSEWSKGI